jgi:hypothetical protein
MKARDLIEGRPSYAIELMREIKGLPSVDQVISTWTQVDGVSGLFRTKDGQAYEIVVRPASAAQHPQLRQYAVSDPEKLRRRGLTRKKIWPA